MTDQLISLETAKLAKEKGCDLKGTTYKPHGNSSIFELDYPITQSLLQKWLRETYFIHIVIQVFHDTSGIGKEWTFSADIFYENGKVNNCGLTEDTYEEALEVGSQAALNLIP